ncbi:hypothetical protein Gohar_019877 [Gossypium harknessii]|uniref:Uncharacterized protein n=1 Tax=Gossypium harknessii TaxID=34285 RepID=A0A7J9HW00_9ROSI|nr:hypothetical protein [Gossypium harknessii]
MEEILKLLPGPHTETKRVSRLLGLGFASSPSFATLQGASNGLDKIADGRRSLVLVVFVGGVTFAEIAALRFLSAQEGMAYDLIIGTTKMVNGHSLVFVSQYFSPTTTENHNYGVLGSEAENVKCLVRRKLLCTASYDCNVMKMNKHFRSVDKTQAGVDNSPVSIQACNDLNLRKFVL